LAFKGIIMAGLFSSGEQDMLGNIVQGRQQANQALGSPYGKYGGIVQAGADLVDVQADAMFGGKTGAADPRMQQANDVKNIFAQVALEVGNTSSADFYEKLSQAMAAKYPEQAQKAADKANELKPKDNSLELLKSFTAESVKAFKNSGGTDFNLLTEKPGEKKTQVVQFNGKQILIDSKDGSTIKELGVAPSKAPIINIAGNQENEFGKSRGKNQADALADAEKAAGSSKVALNALEQMEKVNIDGIYSGPQADALLATNSFLESVGLLNKNQVTKLTDSVTYDKNAKDLVMLDLDGKLGAQVSDADRKYVEARIPQLRTNPQARTELIAKLREIHSSKIDKAEKMIAHANEFNSLNTFKWNPPKPKTAEKGWGIKKVE
jgi:hypothetical protein